MNLIRKIARERLKKDRTRSMLLSLITFFSILTMAFFTALLLSDSIEMQSNAVSSFLGKARSAMQAAGLLLIVATLFLLRLHCNIRREENKQILAVLTSMGATAKQRFALQAWEYVFLYLPAVPTGSFFGCVAGMLAASGLYGAIVWPAFLTFPLLSLTGTLLTALCHFAPALHLKRRDLLGELRRQNREAARHGYRQSETFRQKPVLRQLARKSLDYHERHYTRLALSFCFSLLYPVIGLLLLWSLGNAQVTLGRNDGEASAVLSAVQGILLFLGAGFLLLSLWGLLQALLMAKLQLVRRRKTAEIYRMAGMATNEIQKLLRYELQALFLRTAVYTVMTVVITAALFAMLAG